MRLLWTALLISVSLAGCAGEAADATVEDRNAAAAAAPIEAPVWAIGDSWSFDNTNADGNMSVASIVVTGESGADWIVDTNEPQTAYYDARFDISYLGQVRKADLAGSQGSDRVQYFDFPLEQDKTWTTKWDGFSVEVLVEHLYEGGAHIKAFAGERLFAEYEYDAELRFFASMVFFDEAGQEQYRMETTSSTSGFTGTVYRYTIGEAQTFEGAAGAPVEHVMTIPEGMNELAVTVQAACAGPGSMRIGLQQPDNGQKDAFPAWSPISQPEYVIQAPCPAEIATPTTTIDAFGGEWRVDGLITAQSGDFTVTLEPRALEAIEV